MPRPHGPGTLLDYLDDSYSMVPVSVDLPELENRIRQFLNSWVLGELRPGAHTQLRELIASVARDETEAAS